MRLFRTYMCPSIVRHTLSIIDGLLRRQQKSLIRLVVDPLCLERLPNKIVAFLDYYVISVATNYVTSLWQYPNAILQHTVQCLQSLFDLAIPKPHKLYSPFLNCFLRKHRPEECDLRVDSSQCTAGTAEILSIIQPYPEMERSVKSLGRES